MKTLLAGALLSVAVATSAFGTINPYDIFVLQENGTGDAQFYNFLTFSSNGVFGFDYTNHKPVPVVLGYGLLLNTSTWTESIDTTVFGTVAFTGSYTDLINKPTIPTVLARSFNFTPSHSIQTVAAAANGWQIDSTRDSDVNYAVTITTTASIAGNASGYVVLEVAATNSATATDWTEIARTGNSQALTLAITLQSVQAVPAQLHGIIPGGYYTRLRSVTSSGTVTYAYNSGEEVKL